MNRLAYRLALAPLAAALAGLAGVQWACGTSDDGNPNGDDSSDGGSDASHADAQQPPSTADAGREGGVTVIEAGALPPATFCGLPGSLVFASSGTTRVSGGPSKDLTWLTLPSGYCAHYFGTVGNARQLRFSPTGDLFVASPTQGTTGGGSSGLAAVVVLPDDGHDGVADGVATFLGSLPATQGILFANESFYFQATDPGNTQGQVGTLIRQMPYASGQRVGDPSKAATVATVDLYYSGTHWPKTLDQADDGTIYVGNGGDQGEMCDPGGLPAPLPRRHPRARRDPAEGRERGRHGFPQPDRHQVPARPRSLLQHRAVARLLRRRRRPGEAGHHPPGRRLGIPCCATAGTPYGTVSGGPDCSQVQADVNSFIIGDTPFGFDFMPASWTGAYGGRVVVALHGVYGSWQGARVVAIALDPATGLPEAASDRGAGTPATLADFLTGFDDNLRDHGRPSDVTFGPDGRMFVADDDDGDILWIAPIDLPNPYTSFAGGDGGGG